MRTVLLILCLILALTVSASAQTYQGSQNCQPCHSAKFTQWQSTLHAKIHLIPDSSTIRPLSSFTAGDSISMGASYNNAKVYLRRSGGNFYAKIGAGGTEYEITWTYGWGYKQRYLVKIDSSYYMLPVQWNLNGYMDNGPPNSKWVTYNPGNWFNADGSTKSSAANSFRTKSWDRNCVGCHATGGRVEKVIVGADTTWKASWAGSSNATNIVVGCEACHGPKTGVAGIGHQMNPMKLPGKQAKLEVCGQCHNRASSMPASGTGIGTHEYPVKEADFTYFNPADTLKPLAQFLKMNNPPNATGGQGTWPDLVSARQHHQQYHEIMTSKHFTTPYEEITCFTCHISHTSNPAPNKKAVTDSMYAFFGGQTWGFKVKTEDNTLCLSCHAGYAPFTAISKAWVQNEGSKRDSIGIEVKKHTRHKTYDPTGSGSGNCAKCHMAHTAVSGNPYDISTHTFAVVPPIQTRKYQTTVLAGQKGMTNSCALSCHRNATPPLNFGITDASLTDWSEATDVALADSLWKYWQAWGFTGVKEIAAAEIPTTFELSQNFPNPFNPSTTIMVNVADRGRVSLRIYNIVGQVVATLMDGEYEAGRYSVTWNGKDDWGLQAASGVYLYRMEAGAFAGTKKMVMVK